MGRNRLETTPVAPDAAYDDTHDVVCDDCNQPKKIDEMYHRRRPVGGTSYVTKRCLICNRRKDRINHAVYQAKIRGLGSDETFELLGRYY